MGTTLLDSSSPEYQSAMGRGTLGKVGHQPSLTAAPGSSSPSATHYTLVDKEEVVASREVNRRQKKTGGNDISWIKEDSKLTTLKMKNLFIELPVFIRLYHWNCPNHMPKPGRTAQNQYVN